MSVELLFFTYADRKYEMFAVPYAYFVLRNNPGAKVEICLEDLASFKTDHAASVLALLDLYPDKVLFRQSATVRAQPGVAPNTIRFLEEPCWKAEYIYIGDIDLLIFEDVLAMHIDLMQKNDLPFSNILRKQFATTSKPRLSGLHFAPYDLQYPLVDIRDLDLAKENDEHVLYEQMRRKGVMVPQEFNVRPECGIHFSLSRDPLGRTTGPSSSTYSVKGTHKWGGRHYYSRFLEQIKEPEFCGLLPSLDLQFRLLLLMAEGIVTGAERMLHRVACSYMLDKRMLVAESTFTIEELKGRRKQALLEKNYVAAQALGRTACLIWPGSIDHWFGQAWLWMTLDHPTLAVEALHHICDLPGGKQYLVNSGFVEKNSSALEGSGPEGKALTRRVAVHDA